MRVSFVGAGPGDPELLTLKAYRLLSECDCCIWAGSLVNPKLLEFLPRGAEVLDSASMNLEETTSAIVDAYKLGRKIVRLHTGDPSIYGAIAEQMRRLDRFGIPYEVIPGVSSFQATAASLKIELTLPEVSQSIILSRVEGRTPVPSLQRLEVLAQSRSTLCLFLSVSKVEEIVNRLIPFYGEDCPAACVYKVSWPEERSAKGVLKNLVKLVEFIGAEKTTMIIIGDAVGGEVRAESKLYDKSFSHEFRGDSNE